ncbi:hypothetical protein MAR_029177 [Mya arenaria]|uniref:Uncharacterized protein n=1 Tax=Mya arenaria TaxID=6604 RepID=A0ABY7DFQ0_MYAAR|nr:hypothetical protein MAR_029177 [Mya arenaria]
MRECQVRIMRSNLSFLQSGTNCGPFCLGHPDFTENACNQNHHKLDQVTQTLIDPDEVYGEREQSVTAADEQVQVTLGTPSDELETAKDQVGVGGECEQLETAAGEQVQVTLETAKDSNE